MTNDIPNVSSNSRSKLKTFSLRPFSFIHAIVFERFWLDRASFLLFVSFVSWSSTWGVFDPRCVSLAVTWCTLFGDDELLRSLGWRPSWWTIHAKIEVKRLPGLRCDSRRWGKIVEDLFLLLSSSSFASFQRRNFLLAHDAIRSVDLIDLWLCSDAYSIIKMVSVYSLTLFKRSSLQSFRLLLKDIDAKRRKSKGCRNAKGWIN